MSICRNKCALGTFLDEILERVNHPLPPSHIEIISAKVIHFSFFELEMAGIEVLSFLNDVLLLLKLK